MTDYSKEQLARLASYLPRLQSESFGHWTEMTRDEDGSIVMPEYVTSDLASAFFDTCYDDGWIRNDFRPSEWIGTPDAIALQTEETVLAGASAIELAKLLTTTIVAERFAEGALAEAFESGLISRILQRAATLARQ
jgi:hypothetical protein